MAGVATFPGVPASLEEPDWRLVFPDRRSKDGMGAPWRKVASRYWLRIVGELSAAGTLSIANEHQIKRCVVAYCRFDHAVAKLTAVGAVRPSPRTKVPQHNIWRDEVRHADADATSAEMELGISPRRRGSVAKAKQRETKSAASAYLSSR